MKALKMVDMPNWTKQLTSKIDEELVLS
jgi:hypothetical protein